MGTFASEERLVLPVPAELAAVLADELYRSRDDRSVRLLRLGTVDLGHFRLVSIATVVTPGGFPRLDATYERVYL
jgi:hypothetical protein